MNERFLNKLINGDCYEVLPDIEDCSIDLILTDPPYNTTNCGWECAIDIDDFLHIIRGLSKITEQLLCLEIILSRQM